MREFVESLRRLYLNQRITKEQITYLLDSKRIAEDEMHYVLGE